MSHKKIGDLLTPKIIYWVEIPPMIGEVESIELLKKDVLIISSDLNINQLLTYNKKEDKNTAFFYNFDRLITKYKYHTEQKQIEFITHIVQAIEKLAPDRSIIHSKLINKNIGRIIRSHGIAYIEKNLNDRRIAVQTVIQLIKPLFSNKNRVLRSSLRLNLLSMNYRVKIISQTAKHTKIYGILKDLSLNGACLILLDKRDHIFLRLKEFLKLEFQMRPNYFNISLAIISRIDLQTHEIGISFDITNDKMVHMTDADILTKIILKSVSKAVENAARTG